ATISDQQISTLFWINMLVGAMLALLCLAAAPVLVKFYGEPRLFWVTVALAGGFILNAASVQHTALLVRHMRFVAVTLIEIMSLLASIAVGIGMALTGFAYWALVGAAIVAPAVSAAAAWLATAWIPGSPRSRAKVGSMLHLGGILTLNNLIVYFAYNFEKALLGRYWGTEALGIYGRAYQLINIPTDNINLAVGGVIFSALSRLQNDPIRYKSYFLKGYSLVISLTLPITIFCALFADDIVLVVLGPKWHEVTLIFRLLCPTILIFGLINPFSWLLYSIGLQTRALKLALVIAPLVISAYVFGLPYGTTGVAIAYSAALTVWVVPHVIWTLHGTMISPWDLLSAISRPFLSSIVAAAFA
ncbi:MAG: oligosaccharide flippase family protein, partial [Haliea sp.]